MLNNPNFPSDSGMEERQAQLKARLEAAKTEAQKVALVRSAVENARSAIAQDILSSLKDEISVNNLDEVKVHLRNELQRFSKPLLKMLKEFQVSAEKIEQIEQDMETKAKSAFDDSFQTVIVRKPKEHFIIDNLGDIQFPTDVAVNNLDGLEDCIEELGNVIRDTFNVDIPTPQVHVEAPNVTVTPAPVNIDATDLQPVVDALAPLNLLSNDPTKPIAVRMSDGEEYVDLLRDIAQNTSQPVMMAGGYPDVGITNTDSNPVKVTTAKISGASVTSVNDTASSTTLLSANTSRKGFIIFNDSTVALYVKLGATASATSFTYKLNPNGTLNEPSFPYTGVIDGIWASDASGAARITELS